MPGYLKYIIIAVAGGVLFFPFLGHVHLFDWDEINFAECAREMIVTKDYLRAQIDFMPFWEKPPVFIWMQVLSMKLFGVGEYASRFPNAFMGVVTLLSLYYAGKRVMNERLALWWVALYAATWLPHFYFKSGIIDPTFNYFIFLAFFQLHLLRFSERKMLHALLAGIFLGIAVLTKGPVAILVAGLSFAAYLAINKGLNGFRIKHLLAIVFCSMIPFLLWLFAAVSRHGIVYGRWYMTEFITYQVRLFRTEDSDHGGPFFYHFIVLLVGCFPAAAFLFQYGKRKDQVSDQSRGFSQWMWILFWVVLILFSIVKTKIVHYSSLCYFPLTYLAALQLYRLDSENARLKKIVKIVLLVTGSVMGVVIMILPVIGINKSAIIPLIDDPFAVGNLGADVVWNYTECLWGAGYLIALWVIVFFLNRHFRKGMIALFVVQLFIIQVTILHFTPKIEAYSQRAAIEFYKSFEGRDVYIRPLGYKSYANIFYAKKQPFASKEYSVNSKVNEHWLLYGAIDKPTYFICKIQDSKQYKIMPQLECIGERNGFVFFKRR